MKVVNDSNGRLKSGKVVRLFLCSKSIRTYEKEVLVLCFDDRYNQIAGKSNLMVQEQGGSNE